MKKLLCLIPCLLLLGAGASAKVVDRIVAQVNDDIITLSDLNRELAAYRQELAAKLSGEKLQEAMKRAEKDILEELIRQKLLLQKANELGFGANIEIQVSAYIENLRKENNIKDMEELERALQQQGMSLAGFRERIRNSMITDSLVNEFVRSRITLLTPEIEKYYKEHSAEFTTPEEVTLSEIVIPTEGSPAEAEAKANGILKQIQTGEAFATLASQHSKGPTASKGGGIGSYLTATKLNPEIARAIANVKEGDVTGVLPTSNGYVIYRVDARKPATLKPLDEVREEVRNRIWMQKFNPEYERFIAQLKEDAYIQIFGETK